MKQDFVIFHPFIHRHCAARAVTAGVQLVYRHLCNGGNDGNDDGDDDSNGDGDGGYGGQRRSMYLLLNKTNKKVSANDIDHPVNKEGHKSGHSRSENG